MTLASWEQCTRLSDQRYVNNIGTTQFERKIGLKIGFLEHVYLWPVPLRTLF